MANYSLKIQVRACHSYLQTPCVDPESLPGKPEPVVTVALSTAPGTWQVSVKGTALLLLTQEFWGHQFL